MNLRERKELLANKQAYLNLNAQLTAKRAEGAKLSLKAADTTVTLTEDELKALQDGAIACVAAVNDLEKQIEALGADAQATEQDVADEQTAIAEEEKALKSAANSSLKTKAKQLGGTTVAKSQYLKTKQSSFDFAKHLQNNLGQKMSDVMDTWEDSLIEKGVDLTTKDVTGLAASVLPEPVLVEISNAFNENASLLSHFSLNPLYDIKIAFQAKKNTGRGQKRGAAKTDSDYAFSAVKLSSDTVYTKFPFNYADIKKDTSGAYFNYVNGELAKEVIRIVEQAAIIGDGRAESDEDKITEIKSIAEETDTNLVITEEIDLSADKFTVDDFEAIVVGVNKLSGGGQPILVTSKTIAQKLKLIRDANDRPLDDNRFEVIVPGQEITINGLTFSIQDWMEGATNPIIAFSDKAYMLTGDTPNADKFDWYDIKFNQRQIEFASVMGGRLTKYHSGLKFVQKAN